MRCCFVCAVVLSLSGIAAADDPPPVPRGQAPALLTAQLAAKGSNHVVFMNPVFKSQMVMKDGKQSFTQVASCVPVIVTFDGKAVRAFGVDGKSLGAAEVGKRLAKSAPAVVFHAAEPNPYYLQFLREGTVVFVAPREMFEPRGTAPTGPLLIPKR